MSTRAEHLIGFLPLQNQHIAAQMPAGAQGFAAANRVADAPDDIHNEARFSHREFNLNEFVQNRLENLPVDFVILLFSDKFTLRRIVPVPNYTPADLPESKETTDNSSDSESETRREFVVPAQNATPRTALHDAQKLVGVVLKKNKELEAQLADAQASSSRGKKKDRRQTKGPNTLNYEAVIIDIGKSFAILQFPWVDGTAFTANDELPEASPSEIWKPNPPSKLFPKHLTAMLYEHVPKMYHGLITSEPKFALDFCRYSSAGRSSALKTLKTELTPILVSHKLIADIKDPNAWRGLVLWPDDMAKGLKISPYPPVIYHKGKKTANGLMRSSVLTLCARAILFGPASLQDNGTRRPQGSTLGQMWRMKEPTNGLISFVCTVVIFICYWASVPDSSKPESFEPIGTTSKISFRDIYMRFRWALESKPEDAATHNILRFWHEHLFKNITGVAALSTPSGPGSSYVDEDAELENAMGNMSMGDESSDEENHSLAVRPVPTAPAFRAVIPVPSRAATPPAAPVSVAPSSDDELDESIASPIRRPHRQSHARVMDSDDEAIASGSRANEAGGGTVETHLDLENKLFRLKIVDLRSILAEAEQFLPAKSVKKDFVAAIVANNVAIDIYRARFAA
ncbi:hypothetical protein C8R45DRAFT_1103123 [Mycena sanguinolenta]|nr:hypothetical protein C8R45DRAFT_1103123 [Mycena sanguinolenta]